jgi:hypothetical protein
MLKRTLFTALAVTAGVLATVGVAAPAQAAPPDEINHDQVNQTTGRETERPAVGQPPVHLEGTETELRSGYYGGYQYGWVRLKPGTRYRNHDGLRLQWRSGNSGWQDGPSRLIEPGGPTFTGGKLTQAAHDFNFRACIFRGGNYACTTPW